MFLELAISIECNDVDNNILGGYKERTLYEPRKLSHIGSPLLTGTIHLFVLLTYLQKYKHVEIMNYR